MVKKVYTAFISSAFESLRDERSEVINHLLDFRIMPIGMEHFTISTGDEFSGIAELIDDSDFFVMLMGEYYGSCDQNGISWTEREYNYASSKNKPMIVIMCDELVKNLDKDASLLSDDQSKQIEFSKKILHPRRITSEFTIGKILGQFFNTYNFSKCIGWSRVTPIHPDSKEFDEWKEKNKVFDLSGLWYHVHLNNENEDYIRTGTINITQEFTPEKFTQLHLEGNNFSIKHYDKVQHKLVEDKMKNSHFVGDYTLRENGTIFGIFDTKRMFTDSFGDTVVEKGSRRGIHDFMIDISEATTERFEGEFHDEAPSPKLGRIFVFRSKEERDEFLLEARGSVINTI